MRYQTKCEVVKEVVWHVLGLSCWQEVEVGVELDEEAACGTTLRGAAIDDLDTIGAREVCVSVGKGLLGSSIYSCEHKILGLVVHEHFGHDIELTKHSVLVEAVRVNVGLLRRKYIRLGELVATLSYIERTDIEQLQIQRKHIRCFLGEGDLALLRF